jgi:2-furoyl-CoA dehydrogenase FAD binding subunit
MKPAKFAYARPRELSELTDVLQSEGEGARILAGGLSLGAMLNMRLVMPRLVVDINHVQSLDKTQLAADYVETGALVRQADALVSPELAHEVPLLRAALAHVGHFQTRSRGTLAGSIAHADPSAELPLALTVLGGAIELASHRRSRIVNASEFFLSPLRTARRQNEVITAIRWPKRGNGERFAFREFALRAGDYAIVAVACKARIVKGVVEELRLGLAGVADTPILLDASSAIGERISGSLAEAVSSRTKSLEPTADLHASREYRRQLAGVMTKCALLDVFQPSLETVS